MGERLQTLYCVLRRRTLVQDSSFEYLERISIETPPVLSPTQTLHVVQEEVRPSLYEADEHPHHVEMVFSRQRSENSVISELQMEKLPQDVLSHVK